MVILTLFCCVSLAQEFRMGLRVGPNFTTLYDVKSDGMYSPSLFGGKQNYKMAVGVRGGLVFDVALTDVIGLQPAIYYSLQRYVSKGEFVFADPESKLIEESATMKTEEDYRNQLVQIPVLVNFRLHFKNNYKNSVVFGIGPYFSVAVAGRDVMTGTATDNTTGAIYEIESRENYYKHEEINYYLRNKVDGIAEEYLAKVATHPYKRCDFGFTFALGVELNKFYIGAACDLGVVNSANSKEWEDAGIKGYTQRNVNTQITIGYYFN